MEKHHENTLRCRVDEVMLTGQTFIRWHELSHWFDLTRIAKKPYRVIHEMWDEACKRRGYDTLPLEVRGLGQGNTGGGIRLLRPYLAAIDGEQHSLNNLIV